MAQTILSQILIISYLKKFEKTEKNDITGGKSKVFVSFDKRGTRGLGRLNQAGDS